LDRKYGKRDGLLKDVLEGKMMKKKRTGNQGKE